MEENKEKKVAEFLDGDKTAAEEENAENAKEKKDNGISDPGEQLRKLCKGKLKLMYPFRAHDQDVTELAYDFCGLTGAEMMDALDSAMANNMFVISNAQALALFATTAEKCSPMVDMGGRLTRLYDAKDVRARLASADSVKALQLAKLFYNASGQAGNNNISKE